MNPLSQHLLWMNSRYPLWQPQDAVKFLYQQHFGCGHYIQDETGSLSHLQSEYAKVSPENIPLWEPLGRGWGRLYLAALRPETLPLPLLNRMFFLSSAHLSASVSELEHAFDTLQELCRQGRLSFSPDALSTFLTEYRRQGYPCISHSPIYRQAYHPAYRVLRQEWLRLFPLVSLITEKLQQKPYLIVALDGPAASGKTTLAQLLSQLYHAPVVHMDDFFLPPSLQKAPRLKEPGGNIHYERFETEVLPGLQANRSFSYGCYDCSLQALHGFRSIPASPLRIVEGSYSLHPRWQSLYDIKVFLSLSSQAQQQRILARNGAEGLSAFLNRWIPLENQYFDSFQISSQADIIL